MSCSTPDSHGRHRNLSKQPQLSHFPSQSQSTKQSWTQNYSLSFASKPSKPLSSIFLSSTQLCFRPFEHPLPSFLEQTNPNRAFIPSIPSSRSGRPLNIINRAGNISLRIIKAQLFKHGQYKYIMEPFPTLATSCLPSFSLHFALQGPSFPLDKLLSPCFLNPRNGYICSSSLSLRLMQKCQSYLLASLCPSQSGIR